MIDISITLPIKPEQINGECAKLVTEINARLSEIKILRTMLKVVQESCDHKGQETGSNERDGAWGNPCPTCFWTY